MSPVNIIPICAFSTDVAKVSAKLLYQLANCGVLDNPLISSITINNPSLSLKLFTRSDR